MASYPTGVFSPSARSNGQSIDASHMNDVQGELTAIENALLGTITHSLNVSGASTLATLQAGNSTLSALQAAKSTIVDLQATNSTLANAQIANSTFSVRPVEPPPHAALVFLDSTKTLGSSALSTLSWTAQAVLTNSSAHSTGTNPERLTPQSTGLYQFAAQLYFGAITSQRAVRLLDSTGDQIAQQTFGPSGAVSQDVRINVTGYKRFDALGGYVTCVAVSTAGPSTLSISTGVGESWFAMVKL